MRDASRALPLPLVLTLIVSFAPAGATPPGAAGERSIALNQVGAGELLWNSEAGWVPLPMVGTEVELTVSGIMIHGRVTQSFHNATGDVIEALYVFPLPDRAAVHEMELSIGDRRIVSEIREREEARRTYERAKSTGRKAALVDQQRPNLFTTRVASINPGETIQVRLGYYEEIEYRDGSFRLRFPLAFTPRFVPPAPGLPSVAEDIGAPPAITPGAKIRVTLRPGVPLASVTSASHTIDVERDGPRYVVRPGDGWIAADRDFQLAWRPELKSEPRAALFVEQVRGERYALMMLLPPVADSEAALGLPTETLFVVDVSGSMDGPSIRQARQALHAALARLRPEDRFNILRFAGESEPFRPVFQQAVEENLIAAEAWISGLRAEGGTMIYPALMRALSMMGESRSAHRQRIVFLTDGAVGNERQVLDGVAERIGEIRLHTIGIGSAPNAYLMRKMASLGGGLCEFVSTLDQADNGIAAFFERLDRPVMTDLELRWDGIEPERLAPRGLPDLYAGEPLLVSARLNGEPSGAAVLLSGYTRSGPLETELDFDGRAQTGEGVAVRWARASVGSLMDSLHEGADPGMVRDEVVTLGMAFDMVTAYTSLVAVEERISAEGPYSSRAMAAMLPQGGTDGPPRLLLGLLLSAAGLALLLLARLPR